MLSGHLCRCTGYAPIIAAIEDARDSSSQGAERGGEPRAVVARRLRAASASSRRSPGSATASCCRASRASPAGSGVEPGARVAVVLDNRLETALLYWAAQWAGAVCVPLSWRLSEEELAYCIDDAGADARDPRRRPAAGRARARGRARPRRARDLAPPLHLRHDRAPEGRAPLATRPTAPAASARRCSTATGTATARSA